MRKNISLMLVLVVALIMTGCFFGKDSDGSMDAAVGVDITKLQGAKTTEVMAQADAVDCSCEGKVVPKGIFWHPYPVAYYQFAHGILPEGYCPPEWIWEQQWYFYGHPEAYVNGYPNKGRKSTIMIPEYEAKRVESVEHNGRQLAPGEVPDPLVPADHPCVPDEEPWSVYKGGPDDTPYDELRKLGLTYK